jgi:hypothetical protein
VGRWDQHARRINEARTAARALDWAYQWLQAEIKRVEERRPADAEAYRWEWVDKLASAAQQMPRGRPDRKYTALRRRPRLVVGERRRMTLTNDEQEGGDSDERHGVAPGRR